MMKSEFAPFINKLVQVVQTVFDENKQTVTTDHKEKHDYVTNVDLELEKNIISFIKNEFPLHQVIGEECVTDEIDFSKPTWLIDPLDGTSNFIFDIPFYACSIAYVSDNKVQVGLVIDLTRQEVFTAFRGEGSFLNGERLSTQHCESDFIGISSGFLEQAANNRPSAIIDLRKEGKFRLLGAQALHLCYVAAGRIKACINYEAKAWDDIAGALIIEEAGGSYFSHAGFNINQINIVKSKQNLFSIAEKDQSSVIKNIVSDIELKIL